MGRYEVGPEERVRAEKAALNYMWAGKDVENPELYHLVHDLELAGSPVTGGEN